MTRVHSMLLALAVGLATTTSYAATDMTNTDSHPKVDERGGKTAGEGSSVNSPGGTKDNDSSDTGSNTDAADGAAGGSNSTGEATGSGAGHSGGTAEDQDSR
ncbi:MULTISPECIES: hypothetical protein [Pseudomonas]|jgi:hypothetical protein|uniref:Uncharacterized protein n=1 Tax=Pseudomonas promysalinigenes TaxID=485898 RepID=A0ABY6AWV8_9PSED|nr:MULTISPECIES: hypothetical protein [Pseudomonas]QXI35790.1 hypothetical protein HU725_010830 [Pseudomonas promysalinigenes]UXH42158.1 hypothetical protein N5C08_11775 [Pseudomonas promysalinigenes]